MPYLAKKFQEKLLEDLNSCGLGIDTAYFVMKDVLNELEKQYEKLAAIEPKAREEEIEVGREEELKENEQ